MRRIFILLTLALSLSATAEQVIDVDVTRLVQIADQVVYLENPDLLPGDAVRVNQAPFLMFCGEEEGSCQALINYKFLPTQTRKTWQEDDGRCWEELRYTKFEVRIFEDGSYQTSRNGHGGGGHTISCELLDASEKAQKE